MAGKLTANVMVLDESGNRVVLEAGSDVPKWAADQVGDHCLEQPGDAADKGESARKPRQPASK